MASFTAIQTRRAKNQALSGRGPVRQHHLAGIALAALALLALSTPQAPAGFPAPLCFETGVEPWSVAVGDFNGDGMLDLAVTNEADGTVSVLLGNGDGTFRSSVNFTVGTSPLSVAVGDLNRDGILDLVVANAGTYPNFTDSSVSILLGNGDGTFQTAQSYAAGSDPDSVAIGDLNGDGIPDLVVANAGTYQNSYTDSSVSILLGNGDGTFQAAQKYKAGNNPQCVALGDFNGDGILDLVVANYGTYPNYTDSSVSILLGNGDGTFQTAQKYKTGPQLDSVAVRDFNGDGILDLAVANSGDGGIPGVVNVLLGNGDGTFQAAQDYPAFQGGVLAVGDFNGDGKLDLAVAGGDVYILLGNGDGTFQAAQSYADSSFPQSIAVGDFNGDGNLDLALALNVANTVGVLLGRGDGSFPAAPAVPAGNNPSSLAVADLNGDGFLDLAVANQTEPGTVSILLGNGDGTFQAAQSYAAGSNPVSVAIGDFNGDGIPDLVVANAGDNTVSILLGNSDGTFQAAENYAAGSGPGAWPSETSAVTAISTSPLWEARVSISCWAMATAPSRHPKDIGPASLPATWPSATSTATASSTSL